MLREQPTAPCTGAGWTTAWPRGRSSAERCLAWLVADGLVARDSERTYALP